MKSGEVRVAHNHLVCGFDARALEVIMDAVPYLLSLWDAAADREAHALFPNPQVRGILDTLDAVGNRDIR